MNVGQAVVDWLQSEGYNASFVRDLDPRMDDLDVLALAVRERRVVITMDNDFGELVYRSGKKYVGVLLLCMEDARKSDKYVAYPLGLKGTVVGEGDTYEAGDVAPSYLAGNNDLLCSRKERKWKIKSSLSKR